jgi:hypothetical protein
MPIDRGVIDQQLGALGESRGWWEQREMRDLPAVLHADERILAIARGKIARVRWLRRSWLIVVTERRLLCLRSGNRQSWRQVEVNADQMTRVSLRIGPFRGRVVLAAGGYTYRLLVPRATGYKLLHALSSIGSPAREPLSGLRPTLMVRRVIDHVLALPAVALGPHEREKPAPVIKPGESVVDERVRSLESELDELRQQVDFLEQLLRQHQEAGAVKGAGPG